MVRVNCNVCDDITIIKRRGEMKMKKLMKTLSVLLSAALCMTLLFGCGRFDVFPVDTWIKKAMNSLYPDECARCRDVRTAGEEYFGENCGLAQQYLFYYARENKLNFGEEPKT